MIDVLYIQLAILIAVGFNTIIAYYNWAKKKTEASTPENPIKLTFDPKFIVTAMASFVGSYIVIFAGLLMATPPPSDFILLISAGSVGFTSNIIVNTMIGHQARMLIDWKIAFCFPVGIILGYILMRVWDSIDDYRKRG